MNFFTSTLFCLLSLTLLVHISYGINPLYHFCSNSGTYTSNSPFENNLNTVMSYLPSQAVQGSGFALNSEGKGADTVNGLVLCRGDVQSADCKTCITEATKEIVQRCPNNKGAIIWYDNCLFRYSNVKFFGTIDYEERFYMYNLQNVSDAESFNQKTKEFISDLTNKAYTSRSLFATGETKLDETDKLYGLVQCTRDLSGAQCKKCLDDATSEIRSCCDGKIGGRVVGGSCNFRYELYPFVNSY